MADNPNTTWVAMRHPKIPVEDAAVTTRAAFDEVWEAKGWKLVANSEQDRPDAVDVTLGMPKKVAEAATSTEA